MVRFRDGSNFSIGPDADITLDRFIFNLWLDYPDVGEEEEVVRSTTSAQRAQGAPRDICNPSNPITIPWMSSAASVDMPSPVTFSEVKANPKLSEMALVKMTRLSVQPVREAEWEEVAREHHSEGPHDTADFDIVTLERV